MNMTIYETLQAVAKNPENLPKIALFARECAAAAAAWASIDETDREDRPEL
jgi:hypothetical protein